MLTDARCDIVHQGFADMTQISSTHRKTVITAKIVPMRSRAPAAQWEI